MSSDEAEDLAQEVFLRLFKDGVLEQADRSKGRFRHLVLAVTKNVVGNHLTYIRAKKRGGDAVKSALGDMEVAIPEPDPEAFDLPALGPIPAAVALVEADPVAVGIDRVRASLAEQRDLLDS